MVPFYAVLLELVLGTLSKKQTKVKWKDW